MVRDVSGFCDLIQVEQFSPGDCAPAQVIQWLCETGKSGRFYHLVENHARQWEILCALEEALIEARVNKGWVFAVGRIDGDEETEGWLECEDWILMPYGPERAKVGSDMGIWAVNDFPGVVWASTPAADESGIILNRVLKQGFYIDESLGST